jgi:DNA-binding XRE family transcriptional regulator
MTDLEGYKLQYETEFDNNVKEVVSKVNNISQGEKAAMFGVSRRTIINFEQGKTRSYWLLFCYRMKAYGDAVI